jgi:CRP/FNR family transcriptional regulator, cyclic AMP receptor protein
MEWRLLASLTPSEQRLVLARTHRHRYVKGETLFHEGDLAETIHLIQEGRVVSRRTTPQGDVVTYAVLGPGEAFGEMAMLADDHRRTSTIVAVEPVVTLTLRFDEFRQLCDQHPGVQALLVRILAQRVDRLSTHLIDALYLPADGRVLRALVDLCSQYAESARSVPVTLPLTHVDVAELSGASRPTTNRFLRRLEQDGLVHLSRGHVTIVDVSALRVMST